ncbi:MAG: ABC transporter ATP-binding protein [Bacilli bacterium]
MIKIDHVTKKFGDFTAVDDLDLEIQDGEIFGLIGPNGAGKSTTLKMITGILPPTKGDVLLDNYSITKDTLRAKQQFGFVADSPDMFLGMRGADYLSFVASVYKVNRDEAQEKAIKLAKEFNIYDSLNDYIANYSHGMRQKIFIIGALLHTPSTWILDEPLTGLDPASSFKIKERMREHAAENKSVLFSTHVLEVAEKLCDRIGIISKGKLVFVGTLDDLRKKSGEEGSLEELFLEMVK